jgi:hypothetical protein
MRRPTSSSAPSEPGGRGNRVRRILVLAAVALLSWAAWTIVGGVAGVLYGVASATALIGLLLLALRRQRSTKGALLEGEESPGAPAGTPPGATRRAVRPLPGIRMSRFVRELEEENRLLQEELVQRIEAVRSANELRARSDCLYDEALHRLERTLRHVSRERALLQAELEAALTRRPVVTMEAVVAGQPRALST